MVQPPRCFRIPIFFLLVLLVVSRRASSFTANIAQIVRTATVKRSSSVVYQKVVRPPSGLTDILFLGYLVEYLQDRFELPPDLPMVYEKNIPDESFQEKSSVVVQWDSSLSPDPQKTALNVQIVGIYGDDNTKKDGSSSRLPNMAMVAVSKASTADDTNNSNNFPPMLANLFADSESKILKALDRGLEEFMAGKIKNLGGVSRRRQSLQEGQEALVAELLEIEDDVSSTSNGQHQLQKNVIVTGSKTS